MKWLFLAQGEKLIEYYDVQARVSCLKKREVLIN